MDPLEEGTELNLEDLREWSAFSPTRGQVVEVYLLKTDIVGASDSWAAFLILQVSTRLDGSLVLLVKHLGCEDKEFSKPLDDRFNTADCCLHVCLSVPCIDSGGEGDPLPLTYLHVTHLRVWSLTGFQSVPNYVTAARFKMASGWLEPTVMKRPATRRRGGAPPGDPPPEGDPPKKPGRGPKAKAGANKSKDADNVSKIPEKEKEYLRGKLRDTRLRLQGEEPAGRRKKRSPPPSEVISDEDAEDGQSADEFSYAPDELPLRTGTTLEDQTRELAKADAQGKTRSIRGGDRSGAMARAATRDGALRGLSGQLVQKALEVSKAQKKRTKKKSQKPKTNAEKLSSVLTKILTGSKKEDGKEDPKKKKKKKRKLRDGTIISCSESSDDISSEGTEPETSDTDLEAPLRKKTRDKPGSVLNMLVAHVREQLDQGALMDIPNQKEQMTGGVKVMSYFNLFVKGAYPTHLRELRELHHLAACIDLLRSGDIAKAADGLAGRFIALHQSLVDGGWNAARHLEIYPMEEVSAAGAATILATRKYAKLVAKVQGTAPGSWNTSGPRAGKGWKGKGDWNQVDAKGGGKAEGKGKGKGKKGRGKWDSWEAQNRKDWAASKEKPEEKPKP
eukprot:s378_g26.t1